MPEFAACWRKIASRYENNKTVSGSELLNLKGLGRYSGKTRVPECWPWGKAKVQGTCVDFLDRVWALGTVRTVRMEG